MSCGGRKEFEGDQTLLDRSGGSLPEIAVAVFEALIKL